MNLQKQTFGVGIRCKVDAEYMISKYECSILNGHPLSGLLKIQEDKGNVLNYLGETKVNLTQKLTKGIHHDLLLSYIRQIVRLVNDIRKLGLNTGKLVLHTDWIFLDKEETSLNLIYCPLNGLALSYDARLFLQDLILMASLTGEERAMWKKWLDSSEGLTVSSLSAIKSIPGKAGKETNSSYKWETEKPGRNMWDLNVDEKTLPDDIDEWTQPFELSGYDEAPTGLDDDDENFCSAVLDDDGEAPTGLDDDDEVRTTEDDYQFGMDKEDGTFVESFSQKGATLDISYPMLQRVSTGEEVLITKAEFKLGRSEQRADFVIKNNGGVSNVHAVILKQGRGYYIRDAHSTNGTFLNGNVVAASSPVRLEDNSVIELYNEKLIFRM